jgi:hypothetical protein
MVPGGFIPQSASEWNICVIDISDPFFLTDPLLMRFEFTSDGGNNLYLDDLNIQGIPVGITDLMYDITLTMSLAPNPVDDLSQLRISLAETAYVDLVIRDVLGRIVQVIAARSFVAGEHSLTLRSEGLMTGVYTIEARTWSSRRTLQFVKN